ncbi:MAG: hypothetical protein V1701_11370 [Planctomycetota bacterium]
MWKDYKLKISIDKNSKELIIRGNKKGLEYLSGCCLSVIGKEGTPADHYHLMEGFENLAPSSIPTVICYSDIDSDY